MTKKPEISTSMSASQAATCKLNALWLYIMCHIWENKESKFNDDQKLKELTERSTCMNAFQSTISKPNTKFMDTLHIFSLSPTWLNLVPSTQKCMDNLHECYMMSQRCKTKIQHSTMSKPTKKLQKHKLA